MHQLPSSPTPSGPASPETLGIPVTVTVVDTAHTTDSPTVGVDTDSMYPPYVPYGQEVEVIEDAVIAVDSPALDSPTDRLAIGTAEQIEEPVPERPRPPETLEEQRLAEDVARLWEAAAKTNGTVSISLAMMALKRPGDETNDAYDYMRSKEYLAKHKVRDEYKYDPSTDPAPELTMQNLVAQRYAAIELIRELVRHVEIEGYPEMKWALLGWPMSERQALGLVHPSKEPEIFTALVHGEVSDSMARKLLNMFSGGRASDEELISVVSGVANGIPGKPSDEDLMKTFGSGSIRLVIPGSTPERKFETERIKQQILSINPRDDLMMVRRYWEQSFDLWKDARENTTGGMERTHPTLDDELKTVAYMARHYATRGTATRLAPIVMPVGSEPKNWRRPLLHADGTPPKYYPDKSNGYIQTGGMILPHWLGHRIWGAKFAEDAPGIISPEYIDELKGRIQGSVVAAREAAKKEDPPRYLSNKEAETEGMTLFAWGVNKLAFSPVRKAGIAESYSHDDARNATKHIEGMLKELLYPSDPTRLKKLGRKLVDIGFSKKAARPFDGMVIHN